MKTLRLRPLLTGGFLRATRRPSCAAAAENIVTFGFFAAIPAAWVGSGWERMDRMDGMDGMGGWDSVGRDDPTRRPCPRLLLTLGPCLWTLTSEP